jgi:hypothetical protein
MQRRERYSGRPEEPQLDRLKSGDMNSKHESPSNMPGLSHKRAIDTEKQSVGQILPLLFLQLLQLRNAFLKTVFFRRLVDAQCPVRLDCIVVPSLFCINFC